MPAGNKTAAKTSTSRTHKLKPVSPPPTTSTSTSPTAISNSSSSPLASSPARPKQTRLNVPAHASLYAAVAGRLTSRSVSLTAPSTQRRATPLKDALWLSRRPMRPADALFKHRGAPTRYQEVDVYDAASGLPPGSRGEEVLRRGVLRGRRVIWEDEAVENQEDVRERKRKTLPDSDMLKAIHAYASDFYGAMGLALRRSKNGKRKGVQREMQASFGSMDETALVAFGVLMEESVREALGETGDLAFVEGMVEDGSHGRAEGTGSVDVGVEEDDDEVDVQEVRSGKGKGKRVRIQEDVEVQEESESQNARKKKRRKVDYEGDEDY